MNTIPDAPFLLKPWDATAAAAGLKTASTRRQLAELLGVAYPSFMYFLWGPEHDNNYRTFEVPKKAGGHRLIEAPIGPLAALQRRIADVLAQLYRVPFCAHGFLSNRSIVTNASRHVARSEILNIDLKDYFHSVTFPRLRGALKAPPYSLSEPVATAIAHACCHKGRLPQGAPTSPIASNIVFRSLDREIAKLLKHSGVAYTRYADDLSFSAKEGNLPEWLVSTGPSGATTVGAVLAEVLQKSGFEANPQKVRLQRRTTRQIVTGLVVNERVNVPRRRIRRIRETINACWRFGLDVVAQRALGNKTPGTGPDTRTSFIQRMRGELAFVAMVRGKQDKVYLQLRRQFENVVLGKTPYAPPPQERASEFRASMRILHISDLHFAERDHWEAGPILRRLTEAVRELCDRIGPPDFVACTGDIAFSGKKAEYDLAANWFVNSLLPAGGLPTDRLLLVPGNHDVDRSLISKGARHLRRDILDNPKIIPEIFNGLATDRDALLAGMCEYDRFASALGCASAKTGPWWFQEHTFKHKNKVLFCGLCSPWLSQGTENDHGRLLLSDYQVRCVTPPGPHDLVIGLVHHPLAYLNDGDNGAKKILSSTFNVLLYGHLHDQAARLVVRTEGDALLEVAAGSCYGGGEWINSVNFLEFDLDARRCRLHRQIWDPNIQRWHTDYNSFQGRGYEEISYAPR
ncbi:reverse transcriptase domain-containing protein [Sorangium sp. So ce145]|uniref:reverse transcriptase domain-containing protein n=1 Tax=Sorangium sp. So ce145 TaxID=3133285 RepID=UPI003F5DCA7C